MPRSTLSVAIITHNEERNLARTLTSVRFADEIVVVDSGFDGPDGGELRSRLGREVFVEEWEGICCAAGKENSAIDKCVGTWMLSLDADEELTEELETEIRAMLEADGAVTPPVDGYRLRLRHVFLGRWMRFGGYYPDLKLRLFRRSALMAS